MSLTNPALAVAATTGLALVAVTLQPGGADWPLVGGALGLAAALIWLATRLSSHERANTALLGLAIGCDAVIALLRQAAGGSSSGYAPLAILPVVFVGLALRRRHVAAITACTAAMFGLPIAIAGAPLYPGSGWRGVVLWTAVAGLVGAGANRMMAGQRLQAGLAAARACELDRLVATQTAIATSELDIEAVMSAVVSEARSLTGADAAAVELPEGDQLVYRAVSGTAAPHLGLRLDQRTALSGAALRSGKALLCVDSERDGRVDREACRLVGARSLVVVPLVHDGRTAGVLKVCSGQPSAFDGRHVQLLSALGGMIGVALARAELLDRLRDQASTDELTGLPNRRAWCEQLDLALTRAARSGEPVSVIMLDLDGFKAINDRQGHAAGDRVLRSVSSHWSRAVRAAELLARIGGDEFAVLLEAADEATAERLAARLVASLPGDQRVSYGLATWDGEERSSQLVARADAAMYERKRANTAARRAERR